jgi:putative transposase
MKRISNYLKMRVLGALEYAQGATNLARYQAVSAITFQDEDGQSHRFTWRTIQTWWYFYRAYGITESPVRSDKDTARKVSPERLLEAIEQVLPTFHGKKYNIEEVYRACIEKGLLQRNRIAPNTFRRHVNRFKLLTPTDATTPKSRLAFAKAHANDLWQGDTLHGPYIRTTDGKAQKTYLICFIDDASRVIPHGAFYQADDTPNLLDCLQTAIDKRGVPKAIYVDNGSNYSAKEFALICTRLGIVLLHTPVRDGAAKGKIERFFRTVRDQFLVRDLGHIRSLSALNSEFIRWVEDTYHIREHSTLGMKPIDRFGLDLRLIRHLTAISPYGSELFLLESTRKVRADNTFSYNATHYEAPCDLRNTTITIRHNRADLHFPPIVYQNSERLGIATPLNRIANDRKPDIQF